MRFVLLLIAAVCFAQPARDKSGISGRVVSAASGAPLKKAQVWLEPFAPARGVNTAPAVPPATTDAEGRFSVQGVEPGTYLLNARRSGYLDQGYGAAAPQVVGAPIEIGAGETKRDFLVKLTPQSLLYGKVVDEDGDAVAAAQVTVLRVSYAGGKRHLEEAGSAQSQDDGSFVAGGLTPGRYYVSAAVRNMDEPPGRERHILTYYPSAADPVAASPVQVAAGGDVRGISIRLRKAAVFRVRGRAILAENSTPAGGLALLVFPGGRGARTSDDGRFEFDGVPAGTYSVETQPQQIVSGLASVTVAENDVEGVQLPVGEGVAVGVRFNGGNGKVALTPVGRGADFVAELEAGGDGTARFWRLLPMPYTLEVGGLPAGSYVKGIAFRGQPVTDWTLDLSSGAGGELVIDVSPDGAEVAGKVEQPGAVVQVWPAGGETARSVRADARGEFRFQSLPPGDYRVVAWQEIDDDLAQYAPFRAAFESDAVKVHILERGRERVEPKLISREAAAAEAAKLK
jgi:protocatechuate 3,4-dioxygenase beta subunit